VHIEFLVEEPSAEAAINNLLPKILQDVTYATHPHQGKPDLLAKLPNRLRGYRKWLPRDWRIVVLVDEDRRDCRALKAALEKAAHDAGLVTKSSVTGKGVCQVMNRLAIEELEAWYFGDVDALVAAYPRVPPTLGAKARYRDPDAIRGGTWEGLERVLKEAGHCRGGLPKVETARNVSRHMDPQRNRSKSFQVFRDGLLELAQGGP
jgi:hypothetical protein